MATLVGGPRTGSGTLRGSGNLFDTAAGNVPAGYIDNLSDADIVGDAGANLIFGDLFSPQGFDMESDTIQGGAGNDLIYGDTGPDPLFTDPDWALRSEGPMGGGDFLYGGDGDDTIYGGGGGDAIFGGNGNDRLFQQGGDGNVQGNAGNDVVTGGNGRNTVSGGSGRDTVSGGGGDDLVVGEEIEGAFAEMANDDADLLFGGDGNDALYGGAGGDSMSGGTGNDRLFGGSQLGFTDTLYVDGADVMNGDAGDDQLSGNEGNDRLLGGAGNDTMNGDQGSDLLEGGAGNDVLNGGFDNLGLDVATYESAAGGVRVDLRVVVAQNTISAGLDTLSRIEGLTGSAHADQLTGDGADNLLNGGAGNDTLSGFGGADTIEGGAGNDVITGGDLFDYASYALATGGVTVDLSVVGPLNTIGAGIDTMSGIEGVIGSNFNDRLVGNGAANFLRGGGGNDTLNGGAGADTMGGGLGNDTYVVDNALDVTSEASALASEIDTVQSSVSRTLGANLENLTLVGTAANGNGNALANRITGNAGNNLLTGASGNDTLTGGAGNDALSGGAGSDTLFGGPGLDAFRFDAPPGAGNIDRIGDFSTADDMIQIENAVFASLAAAGPLAAGLLRAGAGVTTAADPNDFLIYNSSTGALFYDGDANGAGLAQQIAILSGAPVVTVADFVVI